jgi:hypothetical protein
VNLNQRRDGGGGGSKDYDLRLEPPDVNALPLDLLRMKGRSEALQRNMKRCKWQSRYQRDKSHFHPKPPIPERCSYCWRKACAVFDESDSLGGI